MHVLLIYSISNTCKWTKLITFFFVSYTFFIYLLYIIFYKNFSFYLLCRQLFVYNWMSYGELKNIGRLFLYMYIWKLNKHIIVEIVFFFEWLKTFKICLRQMNPSCQESVLQKSDMIYSNFMINKPRQDNGQLVCFSGGITLIGDTSSQLPPSNSNNNE